MKQVSPQLLIPKFNDIKQTLISDGGKNALCLALVNLQLAASEIGKVLGLEDVNKFVKAAVKAGALRSTDGENSDGWIMPGGHEKLAELVGLKDVEKKYIKFDRSDIINRLQWGKAVELRDEGKHSLLAYRWFKEGETFFADVLDPWPKTNDTRINLDRAMTQREVNGKWVDSRSIEYIGFYEKIVSSGVA